MAKKQITQKVGVRLEAPFSSVRLNVWQYQFTTDELRPVVRAALAFLRVFIELERDGLGYAFPSLKKIAKHCHISPANVPEVLEEARARGHLYFEEGEAGRGHSGKYWACLWLTEKGSPCRTFEDVDKSREMVSDGEPFANPEKVPAEPEKVPEMLQKVPHGEPDIRQKKKKISKNGKSEAGSLARRLDADERTGEGEGKVRVVTTLTPPPPRMRKIPKWHSKALNRTTIENQVVTALGNGDLKRGYAIVDANPPGEGQRLVERAKDGEDCTEQMIAMRAAAP